MAKAMTDQRVRLTRRLLKDALVQLMREQHISKISVRQICETAGINRSTFYAHYSDPDDLLHRIEQEVMDNLRQYLDKQDYQENRPVSVQVLTRILEYAQENVELFQVLLSENSDAAIQKDIMELAQVVTEQVNSDLDERTKNYFAVYATTACISTLQKWLQDGMVESPEKMSEFLLKLLYHGMSSFR